MLNPFSKAEKLKSAESKPVFQGHIENDGHYYDDAPEGLAALAASGWEIKQQIESLEKQLKAITSQLTLCLESGSALVVEGLCRVTFATRQTMTLTDPDHCKALLGGRFDDLVEQDTRYTLTDKLKELVIDPDHPLSAQLRACIQIKEGVTVSFRAAAKS